MRFFIRDDDDAEEGQVQVAHQVLAYADELQQFNKVARRQNNPLRETMTSWWGGEWPENPTLSTRMISPARNTHISLFIAGQNAPGAQLITDTQSQGFANRLLFCRFHMLGIG